MTHLRAVQKADEQADGEGDLAVGDARGGDGGRALDGAEGDRVGLRGVREREARAPCLPIALARVGASEGAEHGVRGRDHELGRVVGREPGLRGPAESEQREGARFEAVELHVQPRVELGVVLELELRREYAKVRGARCVARRAARRRGKLLAQWRAECGEAVGRRAVRSYPKG